MLDIEIIGDGLSFRSLAGLFGAPMPLSPISLQRRIRTLRWTGTILPMILDRFGDYLNHLDDEL